MTEPNIYLDQQGNYRDRTDENLEVYPPAEDAAPEEAVFIGEGEALPPIDQGTGTELQTETGEDTPPVAKTRKG